MSPRNGGWAAGSFNSNNRGPVERGLRSWPYGVTGSSSSSGRRAGVGLGGLPVQTDQRVEVELAGARNSRNAIDSKVGAGCFGVKSGVY